MPPSFLSLTASTRAMPLRQLLARVRAWWMAELAAMAPISLRQRIGVSRRAVASLRVTPDGIVPPGAGVRWSAASRPASLHLDPALVFETTLKFPRQAEDNLRRIVGHHLGLVIPMDPASLAFDHVIAARDPAEGTLAVAVAVAKRAALEQACAAARQAGFAPVEAVVERGGQIDARFNLLRHDLRAPPGKRRSAFRVMELAALVLFLAAGGVRIYRMDLDRDQLLARIAQLRTEVRAVQQLQDEARQLAESIAVLQGRREAPPPLAVLSELTRLLPDDTWITFLHARDRTLELAGNSKHAASLIGLFEQAPGFQAPRFQSPVTANPDGSEHFDLVVTVRRAAL
jgi:general secretion pathway protein L